MDQLIDCKQYRVAKEFHLVPDIYIYMMNICLLPDSTPSQKVHDHRKVTQSLRGSESNKDTLSKDVLNTTMFSKIFITFAKMMTAHFFKKAESNLICF